MIECFLPAGSPVIPRNRCGRRIRWMEASSLTRRGLLGLGLCSMVPATRANADGSAPWAAAFIRRVGNEIAAIVAAPGSPEMRKRRMATLLDDVVDVSGAARFCLGRFWRQATAEQQQAYVTLFHAVLQRVVLAQISNEQQKDAAIQVSVARPEMRDDGVYVPTIVQRPDTPPFKVTWVVNTNATSPRIIDVIAEGTSLRITIRADYASFLNHHGESIDSLLQALRQQACDNCSTATGVGGQ
jgi:phospholipid transport system substrate-binding protein